MNTNPHEPLGGMSVRITAGEFHNVHDAAERAENLVKQGGLVKLETIDLLSILKDLEAGQELTRAETGPDSMWAHSYHDAISEVRKKIGGQK